EPASADRIHPRGRPGTGPSLTRWPGAALVCRMGRPGPVRLRPQCCPGERVRDRHSPADRLRLVARGPRVLLHPDRCARPVPADERQERVLPDGLGRSRPAHQQPISRSNTMQRGEQLTPEDEKQFEKVCRTLGSSVDWSPHYQTIGARARKAAQAALLRSLARGEAYQAETPGLWDVTFQTAVAQAELEARDYPGHYHKVAFHAPDGADVVIETTRPELLPACVALIAHPDDERYQHLFG